MLRPLVVARVVLAAVLAAGACQRHDNGSPSSDDDDRASCDPRTPRQCIGDDVVACEPDGRSGRRVRTCKAGCRDGACIATCAQDSQQLIYVVDTDDDLMSFDPRKLPGDPFQLVGHLACNSLSSPFSMAVDRAGTAWVLYGDGQLFAVSILDAKCRPSGFRSPRTFGMGFVSDAAGSDAETLYIAANDGTLALDTLAVGAGADYRLRRAGTLTATTGEGPELTGTAGARLFGFYPGDGDLDSPSFVQEIDRATGAGRGSQWAVGAGLGVVTAYAFAQWGGVFYVFVTSTEGGRTVRAVDPKTGGARIVRDQLPFRITGAGVSTCAPERDGG